MESKRPKAYTGNGDYIFISYSNRDEKPVCEAIDILQDSGIHIWYDEDLDAEKITENNERLSTWKAQVKNKIEKDNCRAVIFFFSDNVLKYNKAILFEMEVVRENEKSYCAVSLIQDIYDSKLIKRYISECYDNKKIEIRKLYSDEKTYDDKKDEIIEEETQFHIQFPRDTIVYNYEEQLREKFGRVIRQIKEWGYQEEEIFPDGNIEHNGHIEYFPAIMEATPFNFTYFLLSRVKRGLGKTLNEILKLYMNKVHNWEEYPLKSFLEDDLDTVLKRNDTGLVVCMGKKDISSIKRVLKRRREYAHENPMVVNIYSEKEEVGEITERIRQALQEIVEEQTSLDEIDNLILIQTDSYCQKQKIDPINEINNIQNVLEKWRILLSDKYYFNEVLNRCNEEGVKWLLHQQILNNGETMHRFIDPRMRERWDNILFRERKFGWEEKENV